MTSTPETSIHDRWTIVAIVNHMKGNDVTYHSDLPEGVSSMVDEVTKFEGGFVVNRKMTLTQPLDFMAVKALVQEDP